MLCSATQYSRAWLTCPGGLTRSLSLGRRVRAETEAASITNTAMAAADHKSFVLIIRPNPSSHTCTFHIFHSYGRRLRRCDSERTKRR